MLAGNGGGSSLLVDCARCPARDIECDGCMVTALLDPPQVGLPLDNDERAAVALLVSAGLVSAETAAVARATADDERRFRRVV
ncbi:MAG: hypothetical protein LWW86_00130 [Micrococcales bacterium]|nr:hypothetical protein [Micrococcales bacterium]